MFDQDPSRRAIPVNSDGVARLIGEFHSHLAVIPPVRAEREGLRPLEWEESDLRRIRRSVYDTETGVVDIEAHIRALVQYTEIPYEVVRNISILSLGRIAQKLMQSDGSIAFRHGTFLKIERDAAKASEVFHGELPPDRVVINVWTPGADLSRPPVRRVPAPLLSGS